MDRATYVYEVPNASWYWKEPKERKRGGVEGKVCLNALRSRYQDRKKWVKAILGKMPVCPGKEVETAGRAHKSC